MAHATAGGLGFGAGPLTLGLCPSCVAKSVLVYQVLGLSTLFCIDSSLGIRHNAIHIETQILVMHGLVTGNIFFVIPRNSRTILPNRESATREIHP